MELKNKVLYNPWFKEEFSRKTRVCFEPMKENENTTHQNLWNPGKEVFEMKFILWNSTKHLKKK